LTSRTQHLPLIPKESIFLRELSKLWEHGTRSKPRRPHSILAWCQNLQPPDGHQIIRIIERIAEISDVLGAGPAKTRIWLLCRLSLGLVHWTRGSSP
jgi:hypothetical protein